MGNMIKFLVIALVLFSLSAAASWYWQSQLTPTEESAEDDSGKEGKTKPKAKGEARGETGLSYRPAYNEKMDSVSGLAVSLKTHADSLQQREELLTQKHKSLELIQQDWRIEKLAVEELQRKVDAEMRMLTDRMSALEKARDDGSKQQKEIADKLTELKGKVLEIDDVEASRLKQLASLYEAMEPEKAAGGLANLVESGKLDFAAKVTYAMRQAKAGKVLMAMPQATSSQIIERIRTLKASPSIE